MFEADKLHVVRKQSRQSKMSRKNSLSKLSRYSSPLGSSQRSDKNPKRFSSATNAAAVMAIINLKNREKPQLTHQSFNSSYMRMNSHGSNTNKHV